MKAIGNASECIKRKFLKLPNIQNYEIVQKTNDGFIASVEMEDGYEFQMNVYVIEEVFPSTVIQLLDRVKEKKEVSVLASQYVSERTAELCERSGIGFFDYAGNCWFSGHSIYLCEKGNKNIRPKSNKAVTIFDRRSVVSSCILREMFCDISKEWKLKHLSEKVGCSIGQVSKVVNFLIENAWAEKTTHGYKITAPEDLLKEWNGVYGKKEADAYGCYCLDHIADIEMKLSSMKKDMGINSYLTGIAGGVRYAPVVRYNKIQVYIAPEEIREAISYLKAKEVNSGANLVMLPLENDSYIKDWREIDGFAVVSPLQIYLDSMQLKGRGEEMAEAVLRKEILK